MNIGRMELVVKWYIPDGLPAFSSVGGVPALDHEGAYVAMKGSLVVVAGGAEGEEVEGGTRGCVTEDFEFEIAECCVDCD